MQAQGGLGQEPHRGAVLCAGPNWRMNDSVYELVAARERGGGGNLGLGRDLSCRRHP